MKELRAKFVKSTNLEIDRNIPKNIYGEISFGERVSWILNKEIHFTTSTIERFSHDDKIRLLSVYTKNNRYDFELECDCEIEFDAATKLHEIKKR